MRVRVAIGALVFSVACQCGQSSKEGAVPADMPKKAMLTAVKGEGRPLGLDPGDPGDRTTFQPWDGGTAPQASAAPSAAPAVDPLANWKYFDPPLPLTSTVWTPPSSAPPTQEYRPDNVGRKY